MSTNGNAKRLYVKLLELLGSASQAYDYESDALQSFKPESTDWTALACDWDLEDQGYLVNTRRTMMLLCKATNDDDIEGGRYFWGIHYTQEFSLEDVQMTLDVLASETPDYQTSDASDETERSFQQSIARQFVWHKRCLEVLKMTFQTKGLTSVGMQVLLSTVDFFVLEAFTKMDAAEHNQMEPEKALAELTRIMDTMRSY